jgi:RNA polymerase sigma factor for flagellar operon FliA
MTEHKRAANRELPRALADRYARIVHRHAYRMMRRVPSHVSFEDLVAAGNLGLADALDKADRTRLGGFEAYAEFRIRGAMIDELRGNDPLSRDLRDLNKRLIAAVRALTLELGRPPEEIEVAQRLGLPLATFRDHLAKLSTGILVSLEAAGNDESSALGVQSEAEPPDAQALRSERRRKLAEVFAKLPERLQTVLDLYYAHEHPYRKIGEVLGLTESRVCQLHSEAIVRLRAAYLESDDHDEQLASMPRREVSRRKPMRRAG